MCKFLISYYIESIICKAECITTIEDGTPMKTNVEDLQEELNGHSRIDFPGFLSYERLKARSNHPTLGIDPKRREVSKYTYNLVIVRVKFMCSLAF